MFYKFKYMFTFELLYLIASVKVNTTSCVVVVKEELIFTTNFHIPDDAPTKDKTLAQL